ncbi:MAG: hypothetical protein WCU88_03330 [Elusimicrobiota bacterium]|jgi:undecaprenyl pyrophosphate synthase
MRSNLLLIALFSAASAASAAGFGELSYPGFAALKKEALSQSAGAEKVASQGEMSYRKREALNAVNAKLASLRELVGPEISKEYSDNQLADIGRNFAAQGSSEGLEALKQKAFALAEAKAKTEADQILLKAQKMDFENELVYLVKELGKAVRHLDEIGENY